MARRHQRPRRPAAGWKKLVAEWKRSRLSASKFAAAHDLSPRSLTWWRWHFRQKGLTNSGDGDAPMRLVRLAATPEPVPSHCAPGAWELHNADGDSLRVEQAITDGQLARVLESLWAQR